MTSGIFDLPWWGYVLVALVLTHVTLASVTVFLHRAQAHRALELHPFISHVFRAWLWLTTGTVTKEWVAVHRKHHGRVETSDDPHSPQQVGLHRVLWLGFLLYRQAARDADTLTRHGRGTPDDWIERNLYARHSWAGIALMALLDLVGFGLAPGLAIWSIQMVCIPFWAGGVINGIGHYFGYRNFEVPDASRNIVPWGAVVCGEELHNNHHTYPNSAKLSAKRWELDLGWVYIRALAALHLARVNRLPPEVEIDPRKLHCDADTVRAVTGDRFRVMARYGREVVRRVCRQELRGANARDPGEWMPPRRAWRILVRHSTWLDERSRSWLAGVLERNQALRTVYGMKERLAELTARPAVSHEQLVAGLESWCRQAEAAGIQALESFSRQLRTYTVARLG